MDRVFVDLSTGRRYRSAERQPPNPRLRNMRPFYGVEAFDGKVAMRPLDDDDQDQVERVRADNLEEETDTLRALFLEQSKNYVQWADVRYQRFGHPEMFRLRDVNPYLKNKRVRDEDEAYFEGRGQRKVVHLEDGSVVDVWSLRADPTDLSRHGVDLVNLWLRAAGYDPQAMGALARSNRHLREMMESDLIWLDALEFRWGPTVMRFLGPQKRQVNSWICQALDATTADASRRRKHYPKRLMELFRRTQELPDTVRVQEPFINRRFLPDYLAQYPTRIWQCGDHIYGLFALTLQEAKLGTGSFLTYWMASQEDPFSFAAGLPPTYVRYNLLRNNDETLTWIDNDQSGFLCVVRNARENSAHLVYVPGSAPAVDFFGHAKRHHKQASIAHTLGASFPRHVVVHKDAQKYLDLLTSGAGPATAAMTPSFIALGKHFLIPRDDTGMPLVQTLRQLTGGAVFVSPVSTGASLVVVDKESFFEVSRILDHMTQDDAWRAVDRKEALNLTRRWKARSTVRVGDLICHWRNDRAAMAWCDYSMFNTPTHVFMRTDFPALDLISAACSTCLQSTAHMDAITERPFCTVECQQQWYQTHKRVL